MVGSTSYIQKKSCQANKAFDLVQRPVVQLGGELMWGLLGDALRRPETHLPVIVLLISIYTF